MKGFITFSDEKIGTIFWELPKDLQFDLDGLPYGFRENLEQELQLKLRDLVMLARSITEHARGLIRESHERGDS